MADDDNVGYRRGQSSADCTCISLLLTACLVASTKRVENGFFTKKNIQNCSTY